MIRWSTLDLPSSLWARGTWPGLPPRCWCWRSAARFRAGSTGKSVRDAGAECNTCARMLPRCTIGGSMEREDRIARAYARLAGLRKHCDAEGASENLAGVAMFFDRYVYEFH